jgi:dipeptidase E
MKLLLTSAGIKNTSIHKALLDLLGKPTADSSALCIPTAAYAFPGGAAMAYKLIRGVAASPLCELGWKSLGVLELTALPSIKEEYWVPMVQETDALLVGGGDPAYLCYWMRQSGLADLLPSLRETVYVGVSGGSWVVTPVVATYAGGEGPTGVDRALGLVDFTLYAHLDHPAMPDSSLANIERWAAAVPVPTYAIDDETAIRVTDGAVDVISEGHWKLFAPYEKLPGEYGERSNAGSFPSSRSATTAPE